jgi:hypothetical protein
MKPGGIDVRKFGQVYAHRLRRRHPRFGDRWYYGPIVLHFRPKRYCLPAWVYRQEMTQRFQAWREMTGTAVAA